MPVVQQQVRRIAIVGVIIRRRHLAAHVGDLVLADEHIEVAVVIDVAARQRLCIFQMRVD